ncbi:hypothetical protein GGD55_003056 [Rhizobium giardinii]|uniref:Uncharacterized protein n=1 Tax=Rhizobium giardinii TaxID=56731 RepID=A0A7W8UCT7_9HYPH|nr:hypothetical protein [Rhizobium giardinii]
MPCLQSRAIARSPDSGREGARLTTPQYSNSTLVTDEQLFAIGSQFAFWANKSI